jgi:uncharacterized protein
MKTKKFLSAEWRKLIFANYEVDPAILKKYVPSGTELDSWNNKYYVSLVGFMFCDVKVLGIKVPFHTDFPEVNLRFYVRYKEKDEWKRGVVFIKEIVPKPAIAFVANSLFKERYTTLPMKYEWKNSNDKLLASYQWKKNNKWHKLEVNASASGFALTKNSKEEFITEHFWGYSSMNKTETAEYRVEHPSWNIYPVNDYSIDCDFADMYGIDFSILKNKKPASVFLAEGSDVIVYSKKVL